MRSATRTLFSRLWSPEELIAGSGWTWPKGTNGRKLSGNGRLAVPSIGPVLGSALIEGMRLGRQLHFVLPPFDLIRRTIEGMRHSPRAGRRVVVAEKAAHRELGCFATIFFIHLLSYLSVSTRRKTADEPLRRCPLVRYCLPMYAIKIYAPPRDQDEGSLCQASLRSTLVSWHGASLPLPQSCLTTISAPFACPTIARCGLHRRALLWRRGRLNGSTHNRRPSGCAGAND